MSNFEIATLILVLVFLLWAIIHHSFRPMVLNIAKIFFDKKILSVISLYLLYSACLVFLARSLNLWDSAHWKVTVITIIIAGLPMVFNSTEIKNGFRFVKITVQQTLGLSAILTYFVNLSSFPIYVDLVLMSIVILFSLVSAVAAGREDARPLLAFIRVIMILISLIFMISATINITHIWHDHEAFSTLQEFGITLWLPISLIPFVYLLGFFSQCESLFKMLPCFHDRRNLAPPVQLAIFFGFHMSIALISSFIGEWRVQTSELQSFGEARKFMRRFRHEVRSAD